MHQVRSGAPVPRDQSIDPLVRAELDRILASETFSRSARLSAFLTFIVDQTLAGQGDSLKEQVIAVELYGKGVDFNTAADPIVRVDARRLRDKLREYYATAARHGIVISVPKGSYTPVFEVNAFGAEARRHPISPIHAVQSVAGGTPHRTGDALPDSSSKAQIHVLQHLS
jgi:hypothetical protein